MSTRREQSESFRRILSKRASVLMCLVIDSSVVVQCATTADVKIVARLLTATGAYRVEIGEADRDHFVTAWAVTH